jgi:integrase
MTIAVKIKHVTWRDGRPRFTPGPGLRKLGYKPESIKGPTGNWLPLNEIKPWIKGRLADLAERKTRQVEGKRQAPLPRVVAIYTVEDVFDDLWRDPRFALAGGDTGKRRHGVLAAKTIWDYKNKAKALAKFDPELYTSPAASITRATAKAIHAKLWTDKGLPMANGMLAVWRLAMSHAHDRGKIAQNPLLKLRLKSIDPRLRIGTPAEIDALMTAADKLDPEMGDAIMLALYTGQRQGDVLQLTERNEDNGRIRFIQAKTGARVRVRALPPLAARLAAARARKLANGHAQAPTIVVSRYTGQPIAGMQCTKRFAELRRKAAQAVPSVASLWFMDLRDTAVTRLAMASCTLPEIAAITGHSIETINTIIKHYLELNEAQADAAIDKLSAWLDQEGIAL